VAFEARQHSQPKDCVPTHHQFVLVVFGLRWLHNSWKEATARQKKEKEKERMKALNIFQASERGFLELVQNFLQDERIEINSSSMVVGCLPFFDNTVSLYSSREVKPHFI
jgi:hypothetical protein